MRPECPDLKRRTQLKCDICGKIGHLSLASRSKTSTRSSRDSSTTSKTTNTSAATSRSSTTSTSPERSRERSRKKDKKNKEKNYKRRSDRSSSAEDKSSREERRRRRAGRTPNKADKKDKKPKEKKKKKKKNRKESSDSVNNLEEENNTEELAIKGKRSILVAPKRQEMKEEIMTLDSGSKNSIADEDQAKKNGWKIKPISDYENPNLKNPDGSKFVISGKAEVWIKLSTTAHKRRITFLITPRLESVFIIGLKDLRRLHWLPTSWPADIKRWIGLFKEDAKSETVNNLTERETNTEKEETTTDDDSEDSSDEQNSTNETEEQEKKTARKEAKEDKEEAKEDQDEEDNEEDEEDEEHEVKLSSLMDVKTYRDIPDFQNLPDWLQRTIIEHAEIFSNDENVPQKMNVEPLKLKLKPDVIPPDQHLTASLPPINLRKSADKLIKNMLRRNLIEKADRHTGPTSRAFFKAKRNSEARLLIDYKKSQVNNMLEKPVQPQFSVDQLVTEVPPGMKYWESYSLWFCPFALLPFCPFALLPFCPLPFCFCPFALFPFALMSLPLPPP